LQRLQIQWEEQKEEIGGRVLPLLVEVGEMVERLDDQFVAAEDGALRWRTALFGGAEALGVFEGLIPGITRASQELAKWAAEADDAAAKQRELDLAARDVSDSWMRMPSAVEPATEALDDVGGAAAEAGDEIKQLGDTVKALFNPIRQIRQAEEDWEDAARRQAQALASGRTDTEAATEAGLDLAEAYVDMNVAAGQLDKTGVVGFLRGIAAEAGIAQTSIASLQGALDGLALTNPINIPINVTTTTNTSRGSTSGSAQARTIAGSVRNLVEN
jgi:hypothetical protein